jgi:TonB-linked SusC/RagA family outer membrane protein
MKKQLTLWTHLHPCLCRLTREIKIAFLVLLASISLVSAAADELQQLPISGTVTDTNGEALIGVNVVIKGTTIGITTDINGRYSLNAPDRNGTLVFTFIGYVTQEVPVSGRTTVDVRLAESLTSLDEVVVTALGIKREAKTLGYATAVVNQVQLTENRTSTAMGTLQGKVSGVNITTFGTGPAGSTRIRIRGNSAFSGANLPLLVVNGVPIDNTRFSEGSTDQGDGLSSINPDDIESMTVLKGAAAAALYGSRAKDGVIMITTRSGNETKGFGVTYNVNWTTEKAIDYTDFQTEYGQGEGGLRPTTPFPSSGVWSFGEKIQPGMTQILFDNEEVPYTLVTTKDRFKQFYRTGQNLVNTISFANSGDNGSFDISLANTSNLGIMKNNNFKRNNITLGFSQNISKWITVTGNINYANEIYKNAPTVTNQNGEANTIMTMSNTMPLYLMEKYAEDPVTGKEYVWSRFFPRVNPYFNQRHRFSNNLRDRVLGNVAIRFNLSKDIYIQGRLAQDFYNRRLDYNNPSNKMEGSTPPAGYVNGNYYINGNRFRERNYDVLIGANKTFGVISLNATLGGNQMFRSMQTESQSASDFVQPGLYTIMNGRVKNASHSLTERAVNSIYGSAEVGYKN